MNQKKMDKYEKPNCYNCMNYKTKIALFSDPLINTLTVMRRIKEDGRIRIFYCANEMRSKVNATVVSPLECRNYESMGEPEDWQLELGAFDPDFVKRPKGRPRKAVKE